MAAETVGTVETVETVQTVEIVETVETVEIVAIVATVDTLDPVKSVGQFRKVTDCILSFEACNFLKADASAGSKLLRLEFYHVFLQ